jgi:hypothetical protein
MRETKEIELSGGKKAVINSYITGRESREIQAVFLDGMKFNIDSTGKASANEVDAKLSAKAQDKAIELLVVKIEGEEATKTVLDSVLDLPKVDFDKVISEIDIAQNGLSTEKKTK